MINLYSDSRCPFSHRARIILNLKDMDFKIVDVNIDQRQDLMTLNPYNQTPVLVDDIDKNNKKKDLVLIEPNIICEYIDERFPHPQLMPIEPAEKARLRMIIHHFDKDIFQHLRFLDENVKNKDVKLKKDIDRAKQYVTSGLDSIANLFVVNKKTEFLFGNSFSLLDAAVLPLLWRLEYYEITPKMSWSGMMKYADNFFETPEFVASLTPVEKSMRKQ